MLLATDSLAIFAALYLAYELRSNDPHPFAQPMTPSQFVVTMAVLLPLWSALFAFAGLYRVARRAPWHHDAIRIFAALGSGVMLLIVLDYMRGGIPIFPGRAVPIYALLFATLFVITGRLLIRLAARAMYVRGRGLTSVVLLGTDEIAARIVTEIRRPHCGYRVVGAVNPELDGGRFLGDIPIFRSLDAALEGAHGPIGEVIQAGSFSREDVGRHIARARRHNVTYRFVPDQYGVPVAGSTHEILAGVPILEARLTALAGWSTISKRIFDVTGALLLIAVVAPVVLVVLAGLKLTEPAAPVIYRQDRVGRNGRRIRVTKFRSMAWKYSTGAGRPYQTAQDVFLAMDRPELAEEFSREQKVADDPRVTPLGRVLRRTSLDELPQLFDVLRGDLSLIGPRPITPAELERYGDLRETFLALKPGITGLWQVSGRSNITYAERVELDTFYVQNWSMRLDMSILARTTTAVLAKKGAY